MHYPKIPNTNLSWANTIKSFTVFGHQALLQQLHKSSCTSSPYIVWTCYRLTSPVTLKQFISITKKSSSGNVSNNKIPVKSSKSHRRVWSTCHKSPPAHRAPGHFTFWSETATNKLPLESYTKEKLGASFGIPILLLRKLMIKSSWEM